MPDDPPPEFALIGHPANYAHFVRLMEATAGESAGERLGRHRQSFEKLIDWLPPYLSRHAVAFAADGREVHGRLVICPFLPERLQSPAAIKRAYNKVVEACALAAEQGVRTIALGGFTSIVMRDRGLDFAGVTVTAGASLTAALAVAQMQTALATRGRGIAGEEITVLGATGEVGSVVAGLLARKGGRLRLVARTRADLDRLRAALGSAEAAIVATAEEPLSLSRAIIAATSAPLPLLDHERIGPDTVLCDVGYPKTLSATCHALPGSGAVFAGGVARFPRDLGLKDYTDLGKGDLLFGCFTEGMVLATLPPMQARALAGGSFESAETLLDLAARFGIAPGPVR